MRTTAINSRLRPVLLGSPTTIQMIPNSEELLNLATCVGVSNCLYIYYRDITYSKQCPEKSLIDDVIINNVLTPPQPPPPTTQCKECRWWCLWLRKRKGDDELYTDLLCNGVSYSTHCDLGIYSQPFVERNGFRKKDV